MIDPLEYQTSPSVCIEGKNYNKTDDAAEMVGDGGKLCGGLQVGVLPSRREDRMHV